jgi:hypothetical protein
MIGMGNWNTSIKKGSEGTLSIKYCPFRLLKNVFINSQLILILRKNRILLA